MTVENLKIDAFLHRATRWQEEMRALRDILLECDLTEELKWGKPCYTAHGGNIVIMQPFKAHLSLMFFEGSLLDDDEGLLRSQGENTQADRRMEFTSVEQVSRRSSPLKSYVEEAVAVEEAGLEVPEKKVEDYEVSPRIRDATARRRDLSRSVRGADPREEEELPHTLLGGQAGEHAGTKDREVPGEGPGGERFQ